MKSFALFLLLFPLWSLADKKGVVNQSSPFYGSFLFLEAHSVHAFMETFEKDLEDLFLSRRSLTYIEEMQKEFLQAIVRIHHGQCLSAFESFVSFPLVELFSDYDPFYYWMQSLECLKDSAKEPTLLQAYLKSISQESQDVSRSRRFEYQFSRYALKHQRRGFFQKIKDHFFQGQETQKELFRMQEKILLDQVIVAQKIAVKVLAGLKDLHQTEAQEFFAALKKIGEYEKMKIVSFHLKTLTPNQLESWPSDARPKSIPRSEGIPSSANP